MVTREPAEPGRGDRSPTKEGRADPTLGLIALLSTAVAVGVYSRFGSISLPPRGLNDLVLAGDGAAVGKILAAPTWAHVASLRQAVFLDFWFIPAYVVALSTVVLWARPELESRWIKRLAIPVVGATVLTGVLDVIEDVGVLQILDGNRGNWPTVVTAVAWPKYFLFALCFLYAASVGLSRLKARVQQAIQGARPGASLPGSLLLVPQSAPKATERPDHANHDDTPPWRAKDWAVPAEGDPPKVGISCSGGGIRSAAYNLGTLQALRRGGVLDQAAFVTCVSGGSYIAAAHALTSGETPDPELFDEQPAWALRSPEERHLRANTSYLAPDLAGKGRFVLRILLGFSINVAVLWLGLFILTRPLGWALGSPSVHPELGQGAAVGHLVVGGAMWAAILWPAGVGVALSFLAVFVRFKKDAHYRWTIDAGAAFLGLALLEFLVLVAIPWVGLAIPAGYRWVAHWLGQSHQASEGTQDAKAAKNWSWLVQLLGLGAFAGAVGRIALKKAGRITMLVASLLAPALLIGTTGLLVIDAARRGMRGDFLIFGLHAGTQVAAVLMGLAILLPFYGYSDQVTWSMHPFYKRRLFRAFGVERVNQTTSRRIDYDDPQPLSKYGETATWPGPRRYPELIVCAAANISERGIPTGRKAVSFTFGPKEVGGRDVGWLETKKMEDALWTVRQMDVTLPASVAISGAAISPAMGKMTRPGVTPLLAIANARLGVWLPNPDWMQRFVSFNEGRPPAECVKFQDRPRALYWLKEIVGWHRKGDKFLYVTDGGHFENLGLVELLRRGCTEIFCFDAAGDHIDSFFTFGEAIALARSELGVEISIDPERLEPVVPEKNADPKEHRSKCDVALGTFTYPNGAKGRLIYAKAAVVEDDPWDVKAYGEKDPEFPAHGTVEQLYQEVRFEAYRALGYHAAQHALRLRDGDDPCAAEEPAPTVGAGTPPVVMVEAAMEMVEAVGEAIEAADE